MFILGFGGEVKAEVFYSHGTLNYRSLTYFQWFYPSYNSNVDAYCINSAFNAPSGLNMTQMSGLIPESKKNSIINILKASQSLNLSAGQKYYVTQAAIWYTLYGTGYNGITPAFYNWISTNYSTSWNILMNSRENSLAVPTISIKGNNYNLEVDGDYLISKNFSIASNGISGNYNLTIDSDSGSDETCILVDGSDSCSADKVISTGTNFKVRIKPSSSGEVSAKFTVTPVNKPSVSDIITYGGLSSQGYQNIVVLTNSVKDISKSQTVKGNYVGEKELQVQKVDADTGEKVSGAEFYILDSNNSKVVSVISTGEGEENPKVSLPVGEYKMIENAAPNGYYSSDDAINFSVTNEGIKDKDGNLMTDTVPTISYSNVKIKIKFRKLDRDGNPMEGIKFKIFNALGTDSGDNYILCAYTDAQGYLTRECTGTDKTNNVKSNGEYTIGIDFGSSTGIYRIQEICETDSCKQYTRLSGESSSFGGANGFYIQNSGRQIVLNNNNLSLEYEGNDATPLIIMNMTNKNFLNIGKTDVTTGAEIAGAKLTVTDPSIVPEKITVSDCTEDGINFKQCEVLKNDNVIDSWESDGVSSHEIQGIVPGHKYRLEETIAPEGYIKMSTAIDFIMDSDGNVTTYDVNTGEVINDLKGTDYELLITNDYTKVLVSKTSFTTGEEVAGAELKICTVSSYDKAKSETGDGNNCIADKEEWSWISGDKPNEIDRLAPGEYYIVETLAPEGYVKQTNAVKFEVKEEAGVQQVEFVNEPTKVVISKKDVTTGDEIPGASLKICTLDSYNKDGAECVPSKPEWSWISGDKPNEIEALPFDDYVLIETLPAPDYEEGMIIDGELMTVYNFKISQDNHNVKIDVYNQLLTHVPNTGISTLNLFAIGGLMVFIGYETIKIYRRKALN